MDTYSKFQSLVVLLSALLGVVVTFWPPESARLKLAIVFVFAVLGITAIWLQQQKDNRDKHETEGTKTELLNWQRGDPKNPPRFGLTQNVDPSGALHILFNMQNNSDYPAYDVSGRLWDLDNVLITSPSSGVSLDELLKQDILHVKIPSLSGHSVQTLGPTLVLPTQTSRRFGAQYITRTGGYSQNIAVERVDGKWVFALQVRRAAPPEDVLFEGIDPAFPLNTSGKVDWGRELKQR